MRNNKVIEEIYGMGNDVTTRNYDNDKTWYDTNVDATVRSGLHHTPISRPNDSRKSCGKCISEWQRQICFRIEGKQDTFAGVPPAAGKTDPIKHAWSSLFSNALLSGVNRQSSEFPRFIYIAKTKQLAMESIMQNFYVWIYELLAENDQLFNILRPKSRINNLNKLNQIQQNEIHKLVQELTSIKLGGISSSVILSPEFYFKPIIVTTPTISPVTAINPISKFKSVSAGYIYDYTQIANLITNYSKYFCAIIIDEFQQYMPLPGKDVSYGQFTDDSEKHFDMILKILKNAQAPGKCGVHLLTGTVNKNTAENFCHLVNSELKRNLKPLVFSGNVVSDKTLDDGSGTTIQNPDGSVEKVTEFAGNRSNLTVVPFEKMSTPDERLKLVTDIVRTKQTRSIMVIFSTRRTATTGIFNLLNQAIRKLPARDPNSLFSDSIPDNVSLGQLANRLGDSSAKGGNSVFNDFNANLYPTGLVSNKRFEINDIEYLKFFNVDAAEQQGDTDGATTKLLDKPNENNLLYQGVLRGIGVMVGKMDDRMKSIIVRLFRSERIYLLLATDKKIVRLKFREFSESPITAFIFNHKDIK